MSITVPDPRHSLGVLAVMLLLAGCGKPTGVVSGSVTFKGHLLPYGRVSFVTSDGVVSGRIKEDGTYEVQNVPVGSVKAAVRCLPEDMGRVTTVDPKELGMKSEAGKLPEQMMIGVNQKGRPTVFRIPAEYNDADKSRLRYDVKKGENEINIELGRD